MPKLPRVAAFAAGAVAAAVLLPVSSASAGSSDEDNGGWMLRATLAGSLTTDPPLFGVVRGGVPWTTQHSTVRLAPDGRLDVDVRGLIVPAQQANPVPVLAASVVCNGTVVATTAPVPFSTEGDARIATSVTLPARCLGPVVLLNPNGNPGVYIAATGAQ